LFNCGTKSVDRIGRFLTAVARSALAVSRSAAWHQLHGHIFQAVHHNRADPHRFAIELDPEGSVYQLLVKEPDLDAGELISHAEVLAEAQRQVPVGLSANVESVGNREHFVIAVRRGYPQRYST
jgi:hypothetical protein